MKHFDIDELFDRLRDLMIPQQQGKRQFARNVSITVGLLCLAASFCGLMISFGHSDKPVPLVFVLMVVLTARLTDGFFYSLFATVASVVGVNYVFTYPYFQFNFRATGYPFTFLVMFVVSLVVAMLTDQVKRQSRAQADADREKMKANLLRSVSHDLRTPLTSIIGSSSAVLENYDVFDDETKRELIGHVRDDAQWLMRRVENILSITRMGNGAVNIRKEYEAVEEIAAEAAGKFRARHKDVTVHVSVPDELVMAPMDATLIEQVCINLMENAVQHGSWTTQVELRVLCAGDMVEFSVLDDGQGIDKAVLPRLFNETFLHANDRRVDGGRSLGIGLSTCMSIVRAHGGTMVAENRVGGGAKFSFSLPMGEE